MEQINPTHEQVMRNAHVAMVRDMLNEVVVSSDYSPILGSSIYNSLDTQAKESLHGLIALRRQVENPNLNGNSHYPTEMINDSLASMESRLLGTFASLAQSVIKY